MRNLFVLLAILIGNAGFSQSTNAEELLDEVSQKVKSYDNISIDFKYVLTNLEENIKQETRGSVVLQGNKYVLNFLGITKIFDGKTLYSINPEDEEVTISTQNTDEDNTITPNKMLLFYFFFFTYKIFFIHFLNFIKIHYFYL